MIQERAFLLFLPAIYLLYHVLYRLYLSPLAKVPGPKLAAISQAYEMYYDLIQPARFPWKIIELHEKYGPIVRIAPGEVHINDPDYSDVHFGTKYKQNKYEPHQNQFGMPQSTFATIDDDLHKIRRSAISPYFSRRSTLMIEPMVREKVEKVCSWLEKAKNSHTPIDLRLLFSCMTTDILTDYAFPHCFDLLNTHDLAPAWRSTFSDGLRNFQWFKHFPSLWKLMRSIPDHVMLKLSPNMKITQDWENGNKKLIQEIIDEFDPSKKRDSHPTIFHELLRSELPPNEKSFDRLWQEGSSLIGAGVETTSNTLNVILFYLAINPVYAHQLRKELEELMPNSSRLASWQELEKLPFLSAVISEGLRISYGTTSRSIRVAPKATIHYGEYELPPGTAISMTLMHMCNHPKVFEEPKKFLPERFLGKNTRADILVFGKGPRMCAGQNLAFIELYLALAAIVRRFNLELYETDHSDIEFVCDALMGMPKINTKGVRVTVK